jgi:hypothetical protein
MAWNLRFSGRRATAVSIRRSVIMASIIWTVLVVVLILWLLGFIVGVGGSLIHLLLVVALLLIIYNLLTGRRAV